MNKQNNNNQDKSDYRKSGLISVNNVDSYLISLGYETNPSKEVGRHDLTVILTEELKKSPLAFLLQVKGHSLGKTGSNYSHSVWIKSIAGSGLKKFEYEYHRSNFDIYVIDYSEYVDTFAFIPYTLIKSENIKNVHLFKNNPAKNSFCAYNFPLHKALLYVKLERQLEFLTEHSDDMNKIKLLKVQLDSVYSDIKSNISDDWEEDIARKRKTELNKITDKWSYRDKLMGTKLNQQGKLLERVGNIKIVEDIEKIINFHNKFGHDKMFLKTELDICIRKLKDSYYPTQKLKDLQRRCEKVINE